HRRRPRDRRHRDRGSARALARPGAAGGRRPVSDGARQASLVDGRGRRGPAPRRGRRGVRGARRTRPRVTRTRARFRLMASWKHQAGIAAPVGEVWELLCDPERGPDWAEDVIAVTGAPVRIEKGSTFDVTSRGPLGLKGTTRFKVEAFEEMRE